MVPFIEDTTKYRLVTSNHVKKSGFTSPVRADESGDGAFGDFDGGVIDGMYATKTFTH